MLGSLFRVSKNRFRQHDKSSNVQVWVQNIIVKLVCFIYLLMLLQTNVDSEIYVAYPTAIFLENVNFAGFGDFVFWALFSPFKDLPIMEKNNFMSFILQTLRPPGKFRRAPKEIQDTQRGNKIPVIGRSLKGPKRGEIAKAKNPATFI